MMDRRENLLVRTFALLNSVTGWQCYRNRGDLATLLRPALVLLDADEEIASPPAFTKHPYGQSGQASSLVKMSPEIFAVLADRGTSRADVGQDLNAMRIALCSSILFDDALLGLVTNNGSIRYEGCETDLGYGRDFAGKMKLNFSFTYPFIPTEL